MSYPTYRYLEDRVSLPSTSSSSYSSSASDTDTGESTRTSTSYTEEQVKLELSGDLYDEIRSYSYRSDDTSSPPSSSFIQRHPTPCLLLAIMVAWLIGLHIAYPFPTTIPVFLGAATGLFVVTVLDWYRIIKPLIASWRRHDSSQTLRTSISSTTSSRSSNDLPRSPPPYTTYPQSASVNVSRAKKIRLVLSTALIFFWLHLGIVPPAEHVPVLHRSEPWRPEKYFIAANLYNNEAVFDGWSKELLKLCDYREYPITIETPSLADPVSRPQFDFHLHL